MQVPLYVDIVKAYNEVESTKLYTQVCKKMSMTYTPAYI